MKEERIVVVPGSYDPVTVGHRYLIEYAAKHYKTVYVTVFINPDKRYLFSPEQRLTMLSAVCKSFENVIVDSFDGLQVDYAKEKGITLSVRGFRDEKDRIYEQKIAEFNEKHLPGYHTLLLPCPPSLMQISSTAVREKLARNEDLSGIVPPEIVDFLKFGRFSER